MPSDSRRSTGTSRSKSSYHSHHSHPPRAADSVHTARSSNQIALFGGPVPSDYGGSSQGPDSYFGGSASGSRAGTQYSAPSPRDQGYNERGTFEVLKKGQLGQGPSQMAVSSAWTTEVDADGKPFQVCSVKGSSNNVPTEELAETMRAVADATFPGNVVKTKKPRRRSSSDSKTSGRSATGSRTSDQVSAFSIPPSALQRIAELPDDDARSGASTLHPKDSVSKISRQYSSSRRASNHSRVSSTPSGFTAQEAIDFLQKKRNRG